MNHIPPNPRLAVLIFFFRTNATTGVREVFLGLKKKGEIGSWTRNGPGGKLDPEDRGSLEACLIREVAEEIGKRIDPARAEKTAIITFYKGDVPDFEVHVYRSEEDIGAVAETDDMVPGWFPVDALPFDEMLEADRHWLPLFLAGGRLRGTVHYAEQAKGYENMKVTKVVEL